MSLNFGSFIYKGKEKNLKMRVPCIVKVVFGVRDSIVG